MTKTTDGILLDLGFASLALLLGCPKSELNRLQKLLGDELVADSPGGIVAQIEEGIRDL